MKQLLWNVLRFAKNKLSPLARHVPQIPMLPALSYYSETEAAAYLRQLMNENYTTINLRHVAPDQFQSYITSLPGRQDPAVEGYVDATCQRDHSVQFEWGHNHDFGSFGMHGVMGNRHIDILAAFMSEYGALERNLKGKEILDVGCWTGGASLLLTAMGANVVAVEEVRKYADCLEYLKYAFGLDTLQIQKQSLYSLDSKEFFDRFDIVLYSGVLYHVTDPVLSLRILFNCLKDGGTCLVETQAITGDGSYCEYEGAYNILSRPKGDNLRQGWNWFVPTVKALSRMMKDVGFDVRKAALHEGDRALAIGVRAHHVDMLRAGLSRSHIR